MGSKRTRGFIQQVLMNLSFIVACLFFLSQIFADENPVIGGYPIDPVKYKKLIDTGYLPAITTFMTDEDIAHKLDLTLPELADVKSALEKKDGKSLSHALAGYIDKRMPPLQVESPPKPLPNKEEVERWMQDEIVMGGKVYPLGAKTNWYTGLDHTEYGFGAWNWCYALNDAYLKTGDTRYVKKVLEYTWSFYKNARPPAQPPKILFGYNGPWGEKGQRVHPNYMPYTYRAIAGCPLVTDEDKVMFLKVFYENADYLYRTLARHEAHNFQVHILTGMVNVSLLFPQFIDATKWFDRTGKRYLDHVRDAVLDDGAAWERSGYHYAFMEPYRTGYVRLRDAGISMPDEFPKTIEGMYDWAMWMLAPPLEWPLFGHGGMGPWENYRNSVQHGADLFPNRKDFLYRASLGKEGEPPSRVSRVLHHSGFVTMRSDWSRDALYMALRFNSSNMGIGGHHDMMSFGLWAYGEPLMTNPGTPISYEQTEYDDWCMDNFSHNTIHINWRRHDIIDNAGRVETWASLPETGPGFTYFAGVSRAYESQHAEHRRAVLFIRPDYWLMSDRVEFEPQPGDLLQWYPYDVRWLGHFQPTQLTIDQATKVVSSKEKDGKRLYLIPLYTENLFPGPVEQGSGPIIAREMTDAKSPLNPYRGIGPYIFYRRKGGLEHPVAFTVLLYPVKDGMKQPVVQQLKVREGDKEIYDTDAVGCTVLQGSKEDILMMARTSVLRKYGEGANEVLSDGESGYIRRVDGKVAEIGLVRGTRIEGRGTKLINAGEDVESVYVRYEGDRVEVTASGKGVVSVASGNASQVLLNGRQVEGTLREGSFYLFSGSSEKLTLRDLSFSTDPKDVCRGVGVVYGYRPKIEGKPETGYLGPKHSVVVRWNTPVPSDTVLEYRLIGDEIWQRSINPEFGTDHRIVLSYIKPGGEYELRVTSSDEGGRLGKIETRLPGKITRSVRQ